MTLQSDRILLRQWQDSDYAPFAKMNAHREVMRYFPTPLTEIQSNQLADRLRESIESNGFGFWAVELIDTQQFIGFVGLNQIQADNELAHTIGISHDFLEVGWRLDKKYWGKGYATESAKLALKYAFCELQVNEVHALTALNNLPSQKVMQRIGMTNLQRDFDHPKVAEGHALQRHCLYRIRRKHFLTLNQTQ